MSHHGLCRANRHAISTLPKYSFNSLCLQIIIELCARTVSIYIVNICWLKASLLEGHAYSSCRTFTTISWLGDMEGISRSAITNDFGQYRCTSIHGKLQFLQHHHRCSFTHNKTISIGIKGAPGLLRLIVARRESTSSIASCHCNWRDSSLASAGNHSFGVSPFNDF